MSRFAAPGTGDKTAWMGGLSGTSFLGLPVRLHGIQLGHVVDLIVDPTALRVVGLDLRCGDDEHRFLPLAAAEVRDGELAVSSALTLLEDEELAFYRRSGSTLRVLRGAPVERGGVELGTLKDLIVGERGAIEELVLDGPQGVRRMHPEEPLRLGSQSARAPAAWAR